MRNKIQIIIICILSVCIIALVTYIIVSLNNKKESEQEQNDYISEVIEDECTEDYIEEQKTATVSSEEEKVASNALMILKKYYSNCDHTIDEYVELPQEIVNMTKEEVEEYYSDWKVIGFEKGKITLYKEFEDVCGEHFKLKIENGKVVVYIVNNYGTESVYEKTNISSEYLTDTDLVNMQDGLEIYGKEELNQIIEDFE